MEQELADLRSNITALMQEYREVARDPEGRLRPGPRALEIKETIQILSGELRFFEQTISLLEPTTQVIARSTRLPSNLPKFKRPNSDSHSSVHEFMAAFERLLRADSYPVSKYVFALAASCEPEEAEWVDANLSASDSWDQAKNLFLRHFINDDMEALYSFELETIHRTPSETINVFSDRYLQAMRLASEDSSAPHLRVTHFLTRLPENVRKDLNLVKLTSPINVSSVAAIVRTLVALYPPMNPSAKVHADMPVKWCSLHKVKGHSDAECQAQKRTISAPTTGERTIKKETDPASPWCSLHRTSSHSTNECRANSSNIRNDSQRNSLPAAPTHQPVKCHRCGQQGHYANRCPHPTATQPPVGIDQTRHSAAISSPTVSPAPTETHSVDDTTEPIHSVQDYFRLFDHRPTNHSSSIASSSHAIDYRTAFMVPITINSNLLSAYIDSGASHSSVPAQLITDSDQVRIIQPEPGSKVSLGSKGAFTRRLGSIMLPFEWDGKQFEHVFEIADPPDGIQVIIGRDLFAPLGITISGLPSPFVVGQASAYVEGEFAPDPIVPTSSANPHPVVSSSALQDTIPNNQNIDANSFCNMQEGIVRLDTGDQPPVYCRNAKRSVQTACRSITKLLGGENQNCDIHPHIVQQWMNSKVAQFKSSAPLSVMFGRELPEFTNVISPGIRESSAAATFAKTFSKNEPLYMGQLKILDHKGSPLFREYLTSRPQSPF